MKSFRLFKLLIIFLCAAGTINGQSYISLDLKANMLLYDGKRDKIYAIINGLDMNYGNSFVKIDPYTGNIEDSIIVGSEPACMDFTKDTNYIYLGLDGASYVKRINLNTFQIDQAFIIFNGPDGPRFAEHVATSYLTPDLVVISRKNASVSPRHDGVVAYLRGNKLPGETPNHTGSNVIESANDTNLVFGYNNESSEFGVRRMRVDTTTGVTMIDVNDDLYMGYDFEFEEGLLYSTNGKVLDPMQTPPLVVGIFSNISSDFEVEPDFANNKVFYSTADGGLIIRSYNLQTQALIDIDTLVSAIPDNFDDPMIIDIIRYGYRGLAVIVSENSFDIEERRVILLESCLVIDGTDVAISAGINDTIIFKSDTLDYRITLTGTGQLDAHPVVLRDTLDNTFKIISWASTAGNLGIDGNIIEWDIDTLRPEQTETAIIKIHFSEKGNFLNNIFVTNNGFDCDISNNLYSDPIEVISTEAVNDGLPAGLPVAIYPVPADEYVYLEFCLANPEEEIRITIADMNGLNLFNDNYRGEYGSNKLKIDLRNFCQGVYLVTTQSKEGISRNKIIKL